MKRYKTFRKKIGATVPIAVAIALSAFSASIGVLITAFASAQFFSQSSIRGCYESVVLSSSLSIHGSKPMRSRGGLNYAAKTLSSEVPSDKAQRLLQPSANKDNGPWPKVVWLMSFPNRYVSLCLIVWIFISS